MSAGVVLEDTRNLTGIVDAQRGCVRRARHINGEKATLAEKKATEWPPVSEETDDVAVIVDTKRRSQDSPLDADAGEPCGRQQKPIVAVGPHSGSVKAR